MTRGAKPYQLIDDEFAKKVRTDALTKGLSLIGFNSDVFEGKFDDNRYVQQMRQEFGQQQQPVQQQQMPNVQQPRQNTFVPDPIEWIKQYKDLTELCQLKNLTTIQVEQMVKASQFSYDQLKRMIGGL